MVKKSIEDILVASGVINTQQLSECEKEKEKSGLAVAECLIEKKFITREQLAKAYADYASFEYLDQISEKMIDLELLGKIPLQFLRDNAVIPIKKDGKIVIVTANPMNFQPLDELALLLGGEVSYAVAPASIISESINRYYPLEGGKQMMEELEEEEQKLEGPVELEGIEEKDILTMATEAPIIKLVNQILFQAVKQDASDIHIEPFEKEVRVRFRIDGVLHNIMTLPKRILGAIVSRIKIMANMDIAEKRIPQDGRINIKVADKAFDIRVSILPVSFGERIVMRLLDKTRTFRELDKMGFSEHDLKLVKLAIEEPNGVVFVTGPTGSGKTTTLYSILSVLNKPNTNIVTVEDPVEYQLPGIGQVQVREKVGLTFASALRSILRQDPDIVMIGEIRDQETAQIAIQAALTGHIVLSTLHTNDAPASITRLIDMGIEPFLIASSIILIIAQRLVRILCPKCKEKYTPSQELIKRLGITPQEAKNITFYQAKGCDECGNTGYKGRMPIFEVMQMTDAIAKLTMERADTSQLKKQAIADGMTLLVQDGVRRIKEGLTTIEEVLSVATGSTVDQDLAQEVISEE
jgi:type II secretion system protein E